MNLLLHPAYFPNIVTFSVLVRGNICWEVEDNYQKQTYRNRCYICNDQGKHLLNIPIQHVGGLQGRQKYKDVLLDNSSSWQRQHWRTLQTAYRTSPFFEFYEDELAPLFEKKHHFLLDLNLETIQVVCDCLQLKMPTARTKTYEPEPKDRLDMRFLVNAKQKIPLQQEAYVQVFGDRHGFVKNTSVLDLLFNEGTNALAYLNTQSLPFLHA